MKKLHLFHGQGFEAKESFKDLLLRRAHDKRPYLHFYRRSKVLQWSFETYVKKVAGVKDLFPDVFSLPAGSAVMVMTGNTPETYLLYGALLSAGLTVAPVDPEEGRDFIQTVLKHAEVKAIFVRPGQEVSASVALFSFSHEMVKEEVFGSERGGVARTFFFTSGTTGEPKAVSQNFHALSANLEGTKRAAEISETDILMSCLPLFHVNAFNFSFLLPLYLGRPIVYTEGFSLQFWKIIAAEAVTIGSLSPPIIRALVTDQREKVETPNLRYFISASSALYRSDLETFSARYGVRICQAYGLSETVNFTLFTPPSASREEYALATLSETVPSAGVEVWGNEVFLITDDGQEIHQEKVIGEVCVRGWNVHEGYHRAPEADEEAFRGDYFHTGDAGYFKTIHSKKYFFLTGRLKECLKRLGKLIYLSEIDSAIREMGLREACAVGFLNDHTEEEVGLFHVRQDGDPSAEEILLRLREKLSFAKCPKVVVEGERIPRTAVGKIQRKSLAGSFRAYQKTIFSDRA